MKEPRRFVQVIAGPRQVGKTTLVRQVMEELEFPVHYASADEPSPKDAIWLAQQWDIARLAAGGSGRGALLILDEAQKIQGWSESVKRLWDEDSISGTGLKVIVLGSSWLLLQQGLTESLAGRFEVIRLPHWSFAEMREAFGWDLDRYLYFGAYPGAAPLWEDEPRWRRYILDSLVETTVSRDILLMRRVDKPALLRRLFELACCYSGQILSYQKMLGQLQDAGNTTTLAHYLDLLSGAGMVTGLSKYAGQQVRRRASSPKLLVQNTALLTVHAGLTFQEARAERDFWGRLVESAVGAHLFNGLAGESASLHYWRDRNREVDFVIEIARRLCAIEVKSGRKKGSLPGMEVFERSFKPTSRILVGGSGLSLEDFLGTPPAQLLKTDGAADGGLL